MKKILPLTALIAVAVATVVATVGSAQTTGARTLTLFENTSRESSTFVDNAPASPARDPDSPRFRLSVGDELVARTPVLDRRGGSRVGTAIAHVTVVSGRTFENAVVQGEVVLALRDVMIALTGLAGSAERPFAVVGGTGAYEGASGSATEKETGGGAELTIRLLR